MTLGTGTVRRGDVLGGVLAGAYLAARLPDLVPVPGMLDGRRISGLAQRVLFGLEAAMLFTLAVRLLRVAFARRVEVPG